MGHGDSAVWGVYPRRRLGQDAGIGNLLVFPEDPSRRGEDTLRVLVVDDHPAFRRALTSALKMVKGIEVAGEAGGGREATDRARVDEPDLVLMDLSMPDFDGIEAMRRIHEDRPDLPVVILTAHADPGVEKEAREAGASGFLAKGTALEDIVIVLHEASEGAA
jgi:two-component system, NarL family, invasion response regulator UvrY